jgi:hypothetical protein
MVGLPKPGTLAEVLCIMIWKQRQTLFVGATRAQAQAAVGGEAAVDAFKDFVDMVNRVDIKSRNDKMREQLERLKEIKEIRFQPLVEVERTLNVRKVSREEALARVGAEETLNLKPISRTTPLRRR